MAKQPSTTGNSEKIQQQCTHIKVFALCLLCTVVYVYLYANITYETVAVSGLVKDAFDDLQEWKNKLEKFLNNPVINHDKANNQSEPDRDSLVTLFTTFLASADKYICRNNTISNWISFAPFVKPVFFSDDADLRKRVEEKGWDVLPPTKMSIGIPILKYMYLDVMKKYKSQFYGYVNGDILFVQNLLDTLRFVLQSNINTTHPMLIVGQRTNVKYVKEEQASTYENIIKISKTGKLFTTWGEDYFITSSNYPWKECPDVIVGRVAYDNWLVLNARKRNYTTIDATKTLLALHQTTKKGDHEGHSHPNRNFNGHLLRKLYKSVHYGAGRTSCTTYYTVYNSTNNQIQMNKRKISRGCFPL